MTARTARGVGDMEIDVPSRAVEPEPRRAGGMRSGAAAEHVVVPPAAPGSGPPHPPLRRTSMTARPWAGRPFSRERRDAAAGAFRAAPNRDRASALGRRLALSALAVVGALFGTRAMFDVLPEHGANVAEAGLLVLFAVLFAWISAGFWTAMLGAWVLLRGERGNPFPQRSRNPTAARDPGARTAIVMPICNEHVPTVFGGLRATIESLESTGLADAFDVFVLSDTHDPDVRAGEQEAWTELAAALDAPRPGAPMGDRPRVRLHYRARVHRTRRKAGNIAEFCRRWGAAYRYMIVLDADSVMSGECLTTLVDRMEARPEVGLIQTAPRAWGHTTLHARVQQFASRAYGPLFTAGMQFWQLGESHYWGHNAIVRMAPFIEHCALAPLPGRGSLGGDVISHDFVEAALLRRAGWKVWVAHDIGGSYEQVPPNLVAELQRDRRWCHGNLQNARLLFEPGLHAVHRAAFVTGVLAYVSAPLWLAFLLVSTLLFTRHSGQLPTYFFAPYQLFPIWPTANLRLMLTLFGLTAFLLLAPKVVSLALIAARGGARDFGGLTRMLASAVLEFTHSLLLAPVRMLFHSEFVLTALSGWRLDWKSPPRDDASTGWQEAWRRHGLHTVLAVGWVAAIVAGSGTFQWWLSPIIFGLVVAIPVSVWGSRTAPGRWLRRRRVLLTPEESRMPEVLRDAAGHTAALEGRSHGFVDAVVDRRVQSAVLAALPQRAKAHGRKAVADEVRIAKARFEGPLALTSTDKLRLLSDADALRRLHEQLRAGPAHMAWHRRSDAPARGDGVLGGAEPATI